MRKFQKKQLLALAETMEQLHTEIKRRVNAGDLPTALSLLAQCQDCAVAIGTFIEKTEGEGTQTVGLLEAYCDLLGPVAEALAADKAPSLGQLKKMLIKIENSLQSDFKVKIEVVFFPYKASMWDSLESVWAAARQDDRCECAVVPIPYYERTTDGKLGKLLYDGYQFPAGVPVVDWQSYDLSVIEPDIAYIHNPYDQLNRVTSVHPDFYSYQLKKRVGFLVYIPYYATTGGMADAQAFCSAYYHVDRIIIQAERYRRYFDAKLPAERLLPLGSPKFDRVVRLSEHKPPPPPGWAEKLRGKTVYFYNTSLNGFLADTATFLRKMAYVFQCFQNNRQALLLWRPHPLLESTIDSMRPQFKPQYLQLKQWFLAHGAGIYDDTPDIEASIALSDVYLGDEGTSVPSLFGMAGKPQFFLNPFLLQDPEPEDVTTLVPRERMFREADCMWFVGPYSWLYRLDPQSEAPHPVVLLSELTVSAYCDVVKIGARIFVGPTHAQDICIVENGSLRKIALRQASCKPNAFVKMVRYQQYLYLIPGTYPALVRFDTETEELRYDSQCLEEFTAAADGVRFQQGACVRGNRLYLASAVTHRLLALDLEDGSYAVKKIGGDPVRGCWAMADDGADLWLLPEGGTAVTRWNPETGAVQEYAQYPEGFACRQFPSGALCSERPFSAALCFDRFILLVPFRANMFVRIEKETGAVSQWTPPVSLPDKPRNCYYTSSLPFGATEKTGTSSFMTFCYYDRTLYHIDVETRQCSRRQYGLSPSFIREQEHGFNQISPWVQYGCYENAVNTLPRFLAGALVGQPFDARRQRALYAAIAANDDGTCGEKVHSRIMDDYLQKK